MTRSILVVDDEPDVEALVRQGFRKELKDGLYDIHFAKDGRVALDILQSDPDIGIVMSDINMPRMDGLTLLSQIMEMDRPAVTVMVTAYGDMANIRQSMNSGAFDFLTKPIDIEDFRATLRRAIDHAVWLKRIEAEKDEAVRKQTLLSRHFSPGVARQLSRQEDAAETSSKSETHAASFLFTDIQGFLGLMEALPTDQVMQLINAYMEGVVGAVFEHSGTVMKIIGDSVHATFGAPVEMAEHARSALECALAIDGFARDFQSKCASDGVPLGVTRIGVHSGEAVFGNTGSHSFFDYSAYGDPVNVASRLEKANKIFGTSICVSEDAIRQVADFRGRKVARLELREKPDPIQVYEPVADTARSDTELAKYDRAYAQMADANPSAQRAFAELLIEHEGDPLSAFHLRRILSGVTGDVVPFL